MDTQTRRPTTPDRHRRAGRQSCPESVSADPPADIRGGLYRLQLRVPSRPKPAPRFGCNLRRDHATQGKLGARRRYPRLLRHARSYVADEVLRTSRRRSPDTTTDPQIPAGRRSPRDGQWSKTEVGTPQGAVISPLLANIYLHYVLDLWVQQWRQRHARGEVYIVRFADDFVMGFQYRSDAQRF